LIVANHFLETELEKLRASVSTGYARGRLLPLAHFIALDCILDRVLYLRGQNPVVLSKPGKQVSLRRVRCEFSDPFAVDGLSAKLFQVRLHVPHPDALGGAKLVGSRSTLRTSNIASKIIIGR
jgi:hypothetical protein